MRRAEPSVLHITNGDSAIHAMRAAGVSGDILSWLDVLHEGPVPAGLSAEALAAVRAVFIADSGWDGFAHALTSFRDRDSRLAHAIGREEIVLWFEHDLFDQLQLIQVLDRLAGLEPGGTRITMTCEPAFISETPPERILRLHAGRVAVDDEAMRSAGAAWAAFRAPTPESLQRLVGHDLPGLPFLRAALVRLLEEYPAPASGLGRTETQMLEAVAAGTTTPAKAFRASQAREEAMFMGDATFWQRMDTLLHGARPLLEWTTTPAPEFPPESFEDQRFFEHELRLTEAGRMACDGRFDHAAGNGIDRWIGGVRLGPGNLWRYDPVARTLFPPPA